MLLILSGRSDVLLAQLQCTDYLTWSPVWVTSCFSLELYSTSDLCKVMNASCTALDTAELTVCLAIDAALKQVRGNRLVLQH